MRLLSQGNCLVVELPTWQLPLETVEDLNDVLEILNEPVHVRS